MGFSILILIDFFSFNSDQQKFNSPIENDLKFYIIHGLFITNNSNEKNFVVILHHFIDYSITGLQFPEWCYSYFQRKRICTK